MKIIGSNIYMKEVSYYVTEDGYTAVPTDITRLSDIPTLPKLFKTKKEATQVLKEVKEMRSDISWRIV